MITISGDPKPVFESEAQNKRLARFKGGLKHAGVKLTHQRLEIFREAARSGDHPDAETICRRVRKRMPTVSLDTVYRTLWLLVDFGLIATLGPYRGRVRFEANTDPHHHFVCVKCGLTRDFTCKAFDRLNVPDAVKALGKVDMARVEVRGVCSRCSKPSNPNPRARRTKEEQ